MLPCRTVSSARRKKTLGETVGGDCLAFKDIEDSAWEEITRGQAFRGGKSAWPPKPHFNSKLCLVRSYVARLPPGMLFRMVGRGREFAVMMSARILPTITAFESCAAGCKGASEK